MQSGLLNCRIIFTLTLLVTEMARASTLTVTSTADSGPGTLRDALANAANGDTIDATRVSGTIGLTSGELLVSNNVVIIGRGPTNLAVDGNVSGRVFHISAGTTVRLDGLTITNGADYSYGGGIYNDHGKLTIDNCVVIGNIGGLGGGIANDATSGSATLTVMNSTVTGNSGKFFDSGGGILNLGLDGSATVTIINSTVSDNSAAFLGGLGGGILNLAAGGNAAATITDSSVSDNVADTGAGICNVTSIGNIQGGTATVSVVNSVLYGNSAVVYGGGVFNEGQYGTATVTMQYCTVDGNQSGQFGGGIYNAGWSGTASLAISHCAITDNQALFLGGGLGNGVSGVGSANLTLDNSTLYGNSAGTGGGISDIDDLVGNVVGPTEAFVGILNSTFSDNSGGAIFDAHPFSMSSSTIEIGSTVLNASVSNSTIDVVASSETKLVSLGHNLSSDDGGGVLNNKTDLIDTDPLLGPLQDNGGPTFTCALLPGSPAIDQGKNFSHAIFDQRGPGFVRRDNDTSIRNGPGSDGTDIGAFEVQTKLRKSPFAGRDLQSMR